MRKVIRKEHYAPGEILALNTPIQDGDKQSYTATSVIPRNRAVSGIVPVICFNKPWAINASKIQGAVVDVPNPRISKQGYYLGIAKAVSRRSTCIRRQYGAVLVKDDAIIATGYNGSARGEANCCDTGACAREEQHVPHGERYELCVAVHAEANAISQAGREARGATLYLWGGENGKAIKAVPCMMCERLIKNAGIAEVICGEEEEN